MTRALGLRLLPWIAAAVAILVHARSLDAGFVYDDFPYVVENGDLRGDPSRAASLFLKSFPGTAPERALYRPLTALTLFADGFGGALDPRRFHATNLALLGGLVLAVHALLRRLAGDRAAGAGALLFAVHPVHVEAVAWITGRSELLAALFVALALAAALDFAGRGGAPRLAAAAGFAFAGCLAKESAAAVLPLAGLVLARTRRASAAASPGAMRGAGGGSLRALVGVGAAVALALLVRGGVLGRFAPEAGERVVAGGFADRLPLVLAAAGEHLRLLLVPWPLSVERMPEPPSHLGDSRSLAGLATLLAWGALVAALVRLRAARAAMLAVWPFLALLPVMHLVPIGETVAERFLVLPSVGFAGLLGLAISGGRLPRRAGSAALVGLVLLGGAASAARVEDWRSETRLWMSAARHAPRSPGVYAGLGDARARAGRAAEAASAYRRALALDPNLTVARSSLARVLDALGDTEAALEESFEAVRRDGDHPAALNHLGARLARAGRREEARVFVERALERSPRYGAALLNAALLSVERGDLEAARAFAARARAADPSLPDLPRIEQSLGRPSRESAAPR